MWCRKHFATTFSSSANTFSSCPLLPFLPLMLLIYPFNYNFPFIFLLSSFICHIFPFHISPLNNKGYIPPPEEGGWYCPIYTPLRLPQEKSALTSRDEVVGNHRLLPHLQVGLLSQFGRLHHAHQHIYIGR
jgi:hypothetical protein